MGYYRDLREHIKALEENDKLIRIKREINKDTELHPVVRWQFRGLPEEERKAFLFENVVDSKGREYDIPVLVASHAASRYVYAIGMMCSPYEINEKWTKAQLNPIPPKLVKDGPVHEEVHIGKELKEIGLDEFPIPISTPGFDNAPYTTASNWVTKDPETGIRNIGNYRGQIKARDRMGVFVAPTQHIGIHWKKCKDRGIPLEAAAVIGASPAVGFAAVAKIPYGIDEYSIAGGIAERPIELVKCKTVDIEVPANAEIVIEGRINTEYLEPEGPFGEYTGYVGGRTYYPYFEITCITHRKNPIYNAFISQFPPSESSKIRQIAFNSILYKFLKHDCNIPTVMEVVFHESGGSWQFIVIRIKNENPAHPWQALQAASGFEPSMGKIIIVVDEDVDPWDPDAVNWALSFRMQPNSDVRIISGRAVMLDHSAVPPEEMSMLELNFPKPNGGSSLLINATRKWDYLPVSLPKREYMERARMIWKEEGLPLLKPKAPWYGYPLGYWPDENIEEADLAVKGEHYKTGEKIVKKRIKA
jgi:4-hydroxy-3-polyprenylbenzoate decarboxylase